MATKQYGYNQYKPDGPAGMDIVDAELNRYSPAFDYLSGFVTRSKLKQVDDDRTGTSTSGGSTGGGSTGGGSTVSNQLNTTINVTGGTQTQQTQAAGGDIRDSGQTNTASTTSTTTGGTNTIDTTGGGNGGGGNDDDTVTADYSADFKTEQDAKDFLKNKYQTLLGRDPDEEGEKYFLGNFVSGQDKAADMDKILTSSDEFKARDNVVQTYNQMEGRNPTEQELDSIVNPGGALSTTDTTAGSEFLADYSAKLAAADDDTKKAETLSAAVSSKDDITDIDEKRKYTSLGTDKAEGGFSAKDIYSRGLNVGDLTTTNIDKITQAYQSNFGRAPDKEGFNYWAKQLAATPDYDLDKAFKASAEYKIRNPGT